MKNIHILSTDKPSRLFEILQFNLSFDKTNYFSEDYKKLHKYKNKNIYITNSEEIKEGDWCYHPLLKGGSIIQSRFNNPNSTMKKIILTTDQDLIKDGVQSIDDEFLEWFVKNPSCEWVEILGTPKLVKMIDNEFYKIIIPKEEPKTVFDQLEVGKDYKQEVFELGEEPKQDYNYIIEFGKYLLIKYDGLKSVEEHFEQYYKQTFNK